MKRKLKICHLGTPTPGDRNFYDRWQKLGSITAHPHIDERFDVVIFDDSSIDLAKNLKTELFASAMTGVDHFDALGRTDVPFLNLAGHKGLIEVKSVAQWVIYQILQAVRFGRRVDVPRRIDKLTYGIIGANGRIGVHVEGYLKGLGCNDIYLYDIDDNEEALRKLLTYSDIVTVHIPLKGNEGFLNRTHFCQMKKSAWVINPSRRDVINQQDLKLFSINYFDDFEFNYPEQGTPHIAGHTLDDRITTENMLVDLVAEYFSLD